MSEKACTQCKRVLPLEDFSRYSRAKKDGRAWACKRCMRLANRDWYLRNMEREKARSRAKLLRRVYDISPEQYEALFVAQAGRCAICRCHQTEQKTPRWGVKRRLDVDHSHKTGRVRGLLCATCNRTLGRLENNGWLTPALAYLGLRVGPIAA
jgi:RNA polymerase subunit RPABC4/transcription elongation factor Spt4